ncbi:MAG: hypothetical protein WA139_01460 [Candidatus Aenigmatarchaeota archaeon]
MKALIPSPPPFPAKAGLEKRKMPENAAALTAIQKREGIALAEDMPAKDAPIAAAGIVAKAPAAIPAAGAR